MNIDASGCVYSNSDFESNIGSGGECEGYDFKNYYVDCYSTYLKDKNYTTEVLYEGTSSYIILVHNLIIYINNENDECETKYKKIYYKIKNNLTNKITLEDAFKQLDEQSKEYLEQYLQYDNHNFIESIDKINDITFELACGS
jgi:hypothetical protein